MSKFIVVLRNDWRSGRCIKRWIVGPEGDLRGICECWDEASAYRIADALNAAQLRAASSATKHPSPDTELEAANG
jgi:hypothetical protein